MNEDIGSALAQLVQQEGVAFYGDPRRCEVLLKNVAGNFAPEIFVLVTALRAGVPTELLAAGAGLEDMTVDRLATRLDESFGLHPAAARWAIQSWAGALGVGQAPTAPTPLAAPAGLLPPEPPSGPPPWIVDAVPPSGPPSGGPPTGAYTDRSGGRRRWVPFTAGGTAAMVLIVGLVISQGGKKGSENEVFLEGANANNGPTFTPILGAAPIPPASTVAPESVPPAAAGQLRTASGGAPGLYGGTRDSASCDRNLLINYLQQNPEKAAAWAAVQRILLSQIADFVRSMTSVLLREDTRVTNYGFANGKATPRQSVLQAGTAVLIDRFGVPRTKCFSGNPLSQPTPTAKATYNGQHWPGFDSRTLLVVASAPQPLTTITIIDVITGQPFERGMGPGAPGDSNATGSSSPTTTIQPPQSGTCSPVAVTSMSPTSGPDSGGTRVRIFGCGFTANGGLSEVSFWNLGGAGRGPCARLDPGRMTHTDTEIDGTVLADHPAGNVKNCAFATNGVTTVFVSLGNNPVGYKGPTFTFLSSPPPPPTTVPPIALPPEQQAAQPPEQQTSEPPPQQTTEPATTQPPTTQPATTQPGTTQPGTTQPPPPVASHWGGTWNTDFGTMTLSESGSTVAGSYTFCAGSINGTTSGSTLGGTWSEVCNGHTGSFTFTLSNDGHSFSGTWADADGSGAGAWNGTRVG